jgi:hypothetical protein
MFDLNGFYETDNDSYVLSFEERVVEHFDSPTLNSFIEKRNRLNACFRKLQKLSDSIESEIKEFERNYLIDVLARKFKGDNEFYVPIENEDGYPEKVTVKQAMEMGWLRVVKSWKEYDAFYKKTTIIEDNIPF